MRMGRQLRAAALTLTLGMPHQRRMILLGMADQASDNDTEEHPAGTYWGGWDNLLLWAGYESYTRAAHNAIARAMAALIADKYVVRTSQSYLGRNATYRLNLPPVTHLDLDP